MKLITEEVQKVNFITEGRGASKKMFIEGTFLQGGVKNRNNREYPVHILEREVNRYNETFVCKGRALGELGHPDGPTVNLDRVSHMITGLREEGSQWIGKAKILDTPMGNIAKNLVEGGAQLGVSSRGMGSLKMVNGVNVVQPDFYLATAADIVADPSAPGAFVQGIMEGKEWMLVNGVWTEQDHTQAIQQIRQATRQEIEEVSLRIFGNFLKKL